jgi:hypothetical protein
MTVKVGPTLVTAVKVGSTALTSIKVGSTLVWSQTNLYDGFDRADGPLGSAWTEIASSTYKLGVVSKSLRMNIPDQTGAWFIDLQSSRFRFSAATTAADDGYVETRVANPGSRTYITQVFRRMSLDGTGGVGIQLDTGTVSIVRRTFGTDTVMLNCGVMLGGDIIRLTQAGDLHTMTRNGRFVGEWNDTGHTANKGAAFRSIGAYAQGIKDLFGPRYFSPSLDYIEAL